MFASLRKAFSSFPSPAAMGVRLMQVALFNPPLPTLPSIQGRPNKYTSLLAAHYATKAEGASTADWNHTIVDMILRDHQSVRKIFERYNSAGTSNERLKAFEDLLLELSVHTGVEERVFYPALRSRGIGGSAQLNVAYQDHQKVNDLLITLETMGDVDDPKFAPTMKELMTEVDKHLREEEEKLLPALQKGADREQLLLLGKQAKAARTIVPTRPVKKNKEQA